MATKAQGLPLSFIVIAAISALVLILVIAFTIGGLGSFFRGIVTVGGVEELSAVQTACQTACTTAQTTATTLSGFKGSSYCRTTRTIDLNRNGRADPGESRLNCWRDDVIVTVDEREQELPGPAVPCTVQIGDDVFTIDAGDPANACAALQQP